MKSVLFIILLIILYCIVKKSEKELFENNKISDVKVAICSMVTKQPDFHFWLKYHLDFLKIDYIFLRVEDSPEYKELFKQYGDRIIASFHSKKDIDMKHNYLTIMDRQKEHVNSSCQKAKDLGIDYIFHCDADEIIFVGEKNYMPKNMLLREYLYKVPNEYENIHMKNFEAVFPNTEDKCFNTNKFIDCRKGGCLSYANGKSVGRVNMGVKFRGPHYFTGKTYNIDHNQLSILHFDSCTYKQWETKFDLLKDTNEEKMKKIPFKFYKNSIKKLQKCGGENKNKKECNEELRNYYEEQKVDPYNKRVNLVEKKIN